MKFATIVSRVSDPMLVVASLIVITAITSGMAGPELVKFLLLFFSISIIPPVTLLLWAVKTGRVTNWDVSDRRQRVRVLFVALLFIAVNIALFQALRVPGPIIDLLAIFFLWYVGFFLLTLFGKISGHVGVATFASGIVYMYFGWWWPFVFVPLIAWSRITLKRHSLGQVLAGAVYSGIIFLLLQPWNSSTI